MQYSINNSLNQWLNSESYEDWVKNTEELCKETIDSTGLNQAARLECITLFQNYFTTTKRLTDYPFAKWALKYSDSKAYMLVAFRLKKLFGAQRLRIDPSYLLREAISQGNTELIREIANDRNSDGATRLHSAARKGRLDLLILLLESGADPNLADNDGDTPLMQAVDLEHVDCVKALVANPKTKINQTNHVGHHALTCACLAGNEEIVRILLNVDADIDLVNRAGRNAYVNLELYKHLDAHHRIAELLEAKMDSESLSRSKQILRAIALAHCTNAIGFSQIAHISVELGGGCAQYWMREMSNATEALSKTYPGSIQEKPLIQMLKTGIFVSNQKILELYRKGFPVIQNAGMEGHAEIVLMWKKHFAICNKGALKMFKFEPNHLSEAILDKIQKTQNLDEKAHDEFFFNELPHLLSFSQNSKIENACKLPLQTSENCSWASLEQAVFVYFMLADPSKAKKKFTEWLGFNQIYHLERYLKGSSIDEKLLASSIKTIRETLSKNSKQHKILNQMIK